VQCVVIAELQNCVHTTLSTMMLCMYVVPHINNPTLTIERAQRTRRCVQQRCLMSPSSNPAESSSQYVFANGCMGAVGAVNDASYQPVVAYHFLAVCFHVLLSNHFVRKQVAVYCLGRPLPSPVHVGSTRIDPKRNMSRQN